MFPTSNERDRPDPNPAQGDRATPPTPELEVRVCQHKTCRKDGAAKVLKAFGSQQSPEMTVVPTGCMGNCGNGPMVSVWPAEASYSHVRSRDVAAIIAQHSQSAPGRSPEPAASPQDASTPTRKTDDDSHQSPLSTAVFWPYVALGLALLVALGSILGTALSLG